MKNLIILIVIAIPLIQSCSDNTKKPSGSVISYFKTEDTNAVQTGGVKIIKINTPAGEFNVWTKRTGNNPSAKVLLLHGGPAATHEYFECFDSFFPSEGIEYYYYDQLGSYYSDQPSDTSLWNVDRFVEEVEQVRVALKLDSSNFFLLGHSWGGILAMEYALKYQKNIKGLIISNMMASCPEYGKYADEVLAKQMDPAVLAEIKAIEAIKDYTNPRYMELLIPHHYKKHICKLEEWPDPVNRGFKHLNYEIYLLMQGPSELGIAGKLAKWDRKSDLKNIIVPTLVIGSKYDTMDPEHMKWMATQLPRGSYLYCPEGSHMAMYDDQKTYFRGLIQFIKNVNSDIYDQNK